jgi:HD-GYP domain-containing protein (c-di-GMP phosphodiesterase class II)
MTTTLSHDPYEDACQVITTLLEIAARNGHGGNDLVLHLAEVERVAGRLVATLDDYDVVVGRAMGRYAESGNFIVHHSANVAALVLPPGRELGYDDGQLRTICVASLLHELGTVHIPPGILLKAGKLTGEEWELMRRRPTYTRDMLVQFGDAYLHHAEIAHQVYERMDGSGYPEGLTGAGILPEACIVGAVDFFEACHHERPYKTATDGIRSLVEVKGLFSDKVVKAVINTLGLYPVGSVVELCNGEIATVIKVNKAMPSQPVVEIWFDAGGRRLSEPRRVDLSQAWQLYVIRPLSEDSLRTMNIDMIDRA